MNTVLPLGITCHSDKQRFYLVTENSTYVIGITPDTGQVLNLYWGPRLYSVDDVPPAQLQQERSSQDPSLTAAPEEYPVFGGLRYGQDNLKVTFESGTRELDLAYSEFRTYYEPRLEETMQGQQNKAPNALVLVLSDRYYKKLHVHLTYKLFTNTDIIERSATIINQLSNNNNNNAPASTIHIEKILSAAFHLPPTLLCEPRQLTTLNGAWSAETQVNTTTLQTNSSSGGSGMRYMIGSTRGIPSAQAYPYFALTSDSNLPGKQDTYFGSVAWSGNWMVTIDVDYQGQTRISGGLHSHDFGLTLQSGETFTTPVFMAGYSSSGLTGARQRLPRHISDRRRLYQQQNHQQQRQNSVNPVLYNSWEAAGFDVNFQQQVDLANQAAKLGVELFVVDDGWFHGRTSEHAGLGDWFHDQYKFPQGLKPLADHVHSLNMKFGLWFEPEMVNPDSDLYRQHSDWVYHYRERSRSEERNQLVLDLTNPQVQNYVYEQLKRNIGDIGIDYIKWDMNRPISEAGTLQLNREGGGGGGGADSRDPREVWLRHVNVFYTLLQDLKKEFPHLLIESCCSGGGRADPGVLRLVDQCWTSDNTQPDARLVIQHGISFIVPPKMMSCWVTDMPADDPGSKSISLGYRFHVSFMGALGVGSNILKYTDGQQKEAAYWINLYKQIRHVIQLGDLDWIHSDHTRLVVTMTTTHDRNEAVVLGFRPSSPFWLPIPAIRLRHLDPEAKYILKIWTSIFPGEDDGDDTGWKTYSGANLIYKGLDLPYLASGANKSLVIWIKKISM